MTEDDGWTEAVAVGEIEPGQFAAVLMVAGRSSFTPEAIPGEPAPQKVEAIDVVKRALTGSYSNAKELGDAVWEKIEEALLGSCAACRESYDEQVTEDAKVDADWNYIPKDVEPCPEHGADAPDNNGNQRLLAEGGFTLLVLAVNDSRDLNRPWFYKKAWDSACDRSRALAGRQASYSAMKVNEFDYLSMQQEFGDDDLLTEVESLYRAVARPEDTKYVKVGAPELAWSRTVGGTIRTIVLDPRSGFRWLPPFELPAARDS
ncbi:hypothetical protein [Rhodococcus sp. 66b]|uniref:hypothetical protein n=1 Tax=Rhodococcus sp. 66b TaxID=1945511 RepID=UPI001054F63E|nr:hypothetical protein [Rhodococcus sp. 66b]